MPGTGTGIFGEVLGMGVNVSRQDIGLSLISFVRVKLGKQCPKNGPARFLSSLLKAGKGEPNRAVGILASVFPDTW